MNTPAEKFGFKKIEDDTPRTCANCACSFEQEAPGMGKQLFCRRNTPGAKMVRMEVPAVDREGKPMTNRDGSPRKMSAEQLAFLYPPTLPGLVCYDGWRPVDTLPGEKYQNVATDSYMRDLMQTFDRLKRDMVADATLEISEAQPGDPEYEVDRDGH